MTFQLVIIQTNWQNGLEYGCLDLPFEWLRLELPTDESVLSAARAAVAEYLGTSDGQEDLERYAFPAFDWGDASHSVPKEIWLRHGLRPIENAYFVTDVDYDEDLVPEDFAWPDEPDEAPERTIL